MIALDGVMEQAVIQRRKTKTQADPIGRFVENARNFPNHAAVDVGDCILTYAELAARARRFAACFVRAAGPCILIAMQQGPDAYAAMLGALQSGSYYVPVNVGSPAKKLARLVSAVRPDVIVAEAHLAPDLANSCPDAMIVDPARLECDDTFEDERRRHETAYVIMTSGSTGTPKGVVISTRALLHYLDHLDVSKVFHADDRVSQFPNISFDLSVLDIYGALNAGATLVPIRATGDRLFPAAFAQRHRITVWVSVPSMIDLTITGRQATADMLGTIRLFAFCGEALRRSHLDAIFKACPKAEVLNLYGPTEATVSMTSLRLRAENYADACAESVAIGEPIPGMGLHLVGGTTPGEGEIVITGPQLASEYAGDPQRTAQSFRTVSVGGRNIRGYFTGDWGERRGRHVFFTGRIDSQVKLNGYRVEIGEIITRLADLGWPGACVVKHREALTAIVEADDTRPLDALAVRAQLYAELEPYSVPRVIRAIPRMPRNSNDKLDEAAVRAWLDATPG